MGVCNFSVIRVDLRKVAYFNRKPLLTSIDSIIVVFHVKLKEIPRVKSYRKEVLRAADGCTALQRLRKRVTHHTMIAPQQSLSHQYSPQTLSSASFLYSTHF